jgi:hypothetical protein
MQSMFIIHAGVVEYSQTLHKGGRGSGNKAWLDQFMEVVGQVLALCKPGQIGFWIVLSVILLFVIVRIWLRK